jgi:hypothetical protein
MYESSMLVLMYGCEITSSMTLNSLIEAKVKFNNSKLVIWNNGPEALDMINTAPFEFLGLEVEIVETVENVSLAKVYNEFIKSNSAKRYVILDHDSSLNSIYLKAISNISVAKIGVPKIYDNNKLVGPQLNGVLLSNDIAINDEDKFVAIGSGIVIGRHIVKKLNEYFGLIFDSRYYLYGVDTTFFLRVKLCKLNGSINIINGFSHSLSRLENESDSIKEFRKIERTYDLGLTLRHYYSFHKIVYFLIKFTYKDMKNKFFNRKTTLCYKHFIKALITGKHYRDH